VAKGKGWCECCEVLWVRMEKVSFVRLRWSEKLWRYFYRLIETSFKPQFRPAQSC
jgi:hypothetical protein